MEKSVSVRFTTNVPEDATEEQIKEWLKFSLSGGSCSEDNPLCDRDIEADFSSIQVDRH